MAGDAAHYAERTDDESLVQEVTGRLSKMFAPAEVPQPSEVIVTRWKKDPFACGVYSYVGPLTQVGDYDVMAKPVGRIHFAGEATCGTHPATVHGAYLSGLRAASDVIEEMLGPISMPSPFVPPKLRTQDVPVDGMLNGNGYATSSHRRGHNEEYEAALVGHIHKQIGERPVKPNKKDVNPYLLYQTDHWKDVKAVCDAAAQAKTMNPAAKASRQEIRLALGAQWRNAPDDIKAPYTAKSDAAREATAASTAEYKEKVAIWDSEAARLRKEYMEQNPMPEEVKRPLYDDPSNEVKPGRRAKRGSRAGEVS